MIRRALNSIAVYFCGREAVLFRARYRGSQVFELEFDDGDTVLAQLASHPRAGSVVEIKYGWLGRPKSVDVFS